MGVWGIAGCGSVAALLWTSRLRMCLVIFVLSAFLAQLQIVYAHVGSFDLLSPGTRRGQVRLRSHSQVER